MSSESSVSFPDSGFYNEKKPSPYEQKNGFSEHEQAIEPLLKILHYCALFVRKHNETALAADLEEDMIDDACLHGMLYLEFYEKMLGENFYFNNYRAMRDLIKVFCSNNMSLSKKIAACCLKNLTHYQENIFSYLEALKELVLINDQFSTVRRESIFGFPTILDSKDFWKKMRFGFQVSKDLSVSSIRYRSSLNFNTNPTCFLKLVYESYEKKDGNCIIYLVYLLDMMIESPEVFGQVVSLPSPFHLYANFCDWFVPFAAWYEKDKNISNHSIFVNKASFYEEPFKLKLHAFKELYEAYLKQHHPELDLQKFKMLPEDGLEVEPLKPIFPLSKSLIIGCTKGEELEKGYLIYESDSDFISIKVAQMIVFGAPSAATGQTNLALPGCFRKKTIVYPTTLPKGCGLHKFFDCDEDGNERGRENDHSVRTSLLQAETGSSKRNHGVVLNIPLGNINCDYDDDDETYPTNTSSAKQASEVTASTTEEKALASEVHAEVVDEEYDLKYYRTNYALT